MQAALAQLAEDLEDIVGTRLTRFEQALYAEGQIRGVLQRHGRGLTEPALHLLTEWWDKRWPPAAGQNGMANHHTLQALIASVRGFSEMGS